MSHSPARDRRVAPDRASQGGVTQGLTNAAWVERVITWGLTDISCNALRRALGQEDQGQENQSQENQGQDSHAHRPRLVVDTVADMDEAVTAIRAGDPVAVCVGPGVDAATLRAALDRLHTEGVPLPALIACGVASGPDADLETLAPVFYRSTGPLPARDLAAVIHAARRAHDRNETEPPSAREDGTALDSLTNRADALDAELAACRDGDMGIERLARALREALGADHVDVWIADVDGATLNRPQAGAAARRAPLGSGLVGFAARTGAMLRLPAVQDDPRFDAAVDQPPGLAPGPAHIAGLPEAAAGRAVVVAAYRRAGDEPFDDADHETWSQLLERIRPHLHRWAATEATQDAMVAGARGLYRQEALGAYLESDRAEGDLLRVDPGWTRATYRVLLAFLLVGLVFAIVVPIRDHATGPAVIRFGDRVEITARQAGTVDRVLISPRQSVHAGDLLVRFHGPQETTEFQRLETEFALRLRQRLRDPANRSTEQELIATRTHIELARAKLDDLQVRAPHDGVVSDVRIRPGMHLAAGEVLLTVVTDDRASSVVALLPGAARPTLAPGQPLRLALDGFHGAYQQLKVTSVGQEVIGPAEARRALGSVVADTVLVEGPVVLVTAELAATTFEQDGQVLRLHDGMHGTAEIETRKRPLLLHLVPGLDALLPGQNHG